MNKHAERSIKHPAFIGCSSVAFHVEDGEKVEKRWRDGLCDLLLSEYESLNIDDSDTHCRDFDEFHR